MAMRRALTKASKTRTGRLVLDRERAGLAPVRLLLGDRIGEQPADSRVALGERRRRAGRDHRVHFAGQHHIVQRQALGDRRDVHLGRQIQRQALLAARLVGAAGAVLEGAEIDAVLVLQDAARPQRHRHLVLGHADDPALQVLRGLDPGVGSHVDAAVTEGARDEDRDRRVGAHALAHLHHVARRRQLGDVVRHLGEGAGEDVGRNVDVGLELDALDGDAAVENRPA
ncbi:MAG: hypothetical protein VW405_21940, partial [Rhodospirillaceae bacterium]